MTPREELEQFRALNRMQELQAKSAQVKQAVAPQPFQPAQNQDKSAFQKAQDDDMQRQMAVGSKLAPAMGSFTKGAVEGATMGAVGVDNPNHLPESPGAEQAGSVIGSSVPMAGIGKLLGAGAGIAGDALGSITAKLAKKGVNLSDLLGIASPRTKNILETGAKLLGPDAESGASAVANKASNKGWTFPIQKSR